jgi:hypothetical protein
MALVALIPAAFIVAPAAAHTLIVPLCTGDGAARSLTLPLPQNAPSGRDDAGCCAKGCHTGSRKKAPKSAN